MRVAGDITWLKVPFTEVAYTEELGDKNQTVSQTTYSYLADFTVALCEGPISSITRIWADGKIVYDISDSTNVEALIASGNFAEFFKLYLGTEDELADPTEEAELGVGNVPGYRGTARVVFTQLPLTAWGNRIPNLEFEVVQDTTLAMGQLLLDKPGLTPHYRVNLSIPDYPQAVVTEFSTVIRVANTGYTRDRYNVKVYDLEGNYLSTENPTERELGIIDAHRVAGGTPSMFCMRLPDANCLWAEATPNALSPGAVFRDVAAPFDDPTGGAAYSGSYLVLDPLLPPGVNVVGVTPCTDDYHFIVWVAPAPFTSADSWYLVRYTGEFEIVRSGTIDAAITINEYDVGYNAICASSTGSFGTGILEDDFVHMWIKHHSDGNLQVWKISDADVVEKILQFTPPSDLPCPGLFASNGLLAWVSGDTTTGNTSRLLIYSRLPYEDGGGVTLGEICEQICERAGLDSSDLDTADLTETVHGYALASHMSARGALEQLAAIHQFAVVESDAALKFRYRNGTPTELIPLDDLGANVESKGNVAYVESDRMQETELPQRVNLRYISVGALYQIGAQSRARSTTGSRDPHNIEAAIAMTDDRAAQAADSILYEQWVGRVSRKFKTLRAWSHIEPTDIVQVEDRAAIHTLRILTKRESGSVLEFDGIDVAPSVYDSSAIGSITPGGGQTPTVKAMTRIVLMDIPQLRDEDDNAGLYGAAYPYGSGSWTGAAILRADGSAGPFTEVASVFVEGTVGRATNALPDWVSGNSTDFGSSVDVELFSGAVDSITLDELWSHGNLALLGDEIIQFKTAELVSGTTYRLSYLLRGRKGTYSTGHALGDRFVLLDYATLFRVPVPLDMVGAPRFYRAVTFGAAQANSTYDIELLHTGAAIKPLPGGNIVGVRDLEDNDVVIRWHRRARIATAWRDLVDVPLDETAEEYEVDFYDEANTTFLRTIEATTPEVTYTSADQITDTGVDTNALWARVYQLSDRVGRGFVGQVLVGILSTSFITEGGDPLTTELGDYLITE
jgi:hypothetical protein